MGDIRKQRKKFSKPGHPWNKERILAEKELVKEYGFKRKKEIWKMNSILNNFARQAKDLIRKDDDVKKSQLLGRLTSLGLLKGGDSVENVLSIELKDLLERRLQTVVFKKNLARTISQARQFIVHEHIMVGGKKITVPNYLVTVSEEAKIEYAPDSGLVSPEHPERAPVKSKKAEAKEEEKKPEEKKEKKKEVKEKKVSKKKADSKKEEKKKSDKADVKETETAKKEDKKEEAPKEK